MTNTRESVTTELSNRLKQVEINPDPRRISLRKEASRSRWFNEVFLAVTSKGDSISFSTPSSLLAGVPWKSHSLANHRLCFRRNDELGLIMPRPSPAREKVTRLPRGITKKKTKGSALENAAGLVYSVGRRVFLC